MRSRKLGGEDGIHFQKTDGRLKIIIDGWHLLDYHYDHADVTRPFFANVYSHSEKPVLVSRNFPPRPGADDSDHGKMHPGNFRRPWFHSRDYGAAVLNPFGRRAMRQGPPSRVLVRKGESFRFRAGVYVHDALTKSVDLRLAYRTFQALWQ